MLSWIWAVVFLSVLANGWRLRGHVRRLPVLAASDEPVSPDCVFLVARGVVLDDATRRAACAHARAHDLPWVDLLPEDLPVERALFAVRVHVTPTYRTGEAGSGAGYVLVVRRALWERAQIQASGASLEAAEPELMATTTRRLAGFARTGGDLVVAPRLRTPAVEPDAGLEFWARLFKGGVPFVAGVHVSEQLLLWAGLVLAPLAGWIALAAFHLQPGLIFRGSALRPRDLAAHVLLRSPRVLLTMVQLVSRWIAARDVQADQRRREHYREALSGELARYFEPRREDCPACGALELSPWVRSPDFAQQKPGEFVLERCARCGHVFQNPMLSPAGLSLYYEDFYDGIGEDAMAMVFGTSDRDYTVRAESVQGLHEPRRWLDVGTGHGHFCVGARQIWPRTRFDGLDMSSAIEVAARRGWVEQGYRGLFPEIAPKLEGAYDVVSMFHSLEHTRDPWVELDAAATTLAPGGLLVIEVPDPECVYGRWLGRYWLPWFQPQHLHLLSIGNLRRALEERGFVMRREQRGECHIPLELSFAVFAGLGEISPQLDLPWRPHDGIGRRLGRATVLLASAPFLACAWLLDQLSGYGARNWGWPSNTYRVVAEKTASAETASAETASAKTGVGGPVMEGSST